jgi:Ca2+-binding EF-hand superfamily protein
MGISNEVRNEIEEIFSTLSDTGDLRGLLPGTKLALAASAFDLVLKPTTLSFYNGEKGGKSNDLNFETFVVLLTTAINQDPSYLENDVMESFDHFDPSQKGVCEAGEIHRWLNLLGEHVDLAEVERQIGNQDASGSNDKGDGKQQQQQQQESKESETLSFPQYMNLVLSAPNPTVE